MAGQSTSASSIAERINPDLPLILCPDCNKRTIVERKSTKEWSKDTVFYTCPSHQKDGTGYGFWFWEEGYAQYLKEKFKQGIEEPERDGEAVEELKRDGGGDPTVKTAVKKSLDRGNDAELTAAMLALLGVGKEIVA